MTRNIAAIALFAATSLVTATGVSAQASGVQATIPFEFTVGNHLLPPGAYRIIPQNSHQLLITRKDGSTSMFAMANPGETSAGEHGKLVFNRIGDHYCLTKIVSTSPGTSVELMTPKSSERVMKTAALQSDVKTVTATN